jgi:hypothetical protein
MTEETPVFPISHPTESIDSLKIETPITPFLLKDQAILSFEEEDTLVSNVDSSSSDKPISSETGLLTTTESLVVNDDNINEVEETLNPVVTGPESVVVLSETESEPYEPLLTDEEVIEEQQVEPASVSDNLNQSIESDVNISQNENHFDKQENNQDNFSFSPLNPVSCSEKNTAETKGNNVVKSSVDSNSQEESFPERDPVLYAYHPIHSVRFTTTDDILQSFPHGSRLFIGRLATEKISRPELAQIFAKYGNIHEISLKNAFGFIQFETTEACQSAIANEQGTNLGGMTIGMFFFTFYIYIYM